MFKLLSLLFCGKKRQSSLGRFNEKSLPQPASLGNQGARPKNGEYIVPLVKDVTPQVSLQSVLPPTLPDPHR
jgi:hypothetical protein